MKLLSFPMGKASEHVPGANEPRLDCYLQDVMPQDPEGYALPAVIIYPGGGYQHLSAREAEPIAMAFAAKGYQTFILYYSLSPARYPLPLIEGARAVSLVREHAAEWKVDPEKIAVCGFSAGAHAAALITCLWEDDEVKKAGLDPALCRPDASVLGYPVITGREGHCHDGSFRNLLGEECDGRRYEFSLENRVNDRMPPVFLWHTASDQAVPVESSLWFAEALVDAGVPFELHVFPEGPQGLSLANRRTSGGKPEKENKTDAQWIDLCTDWLGRTFGES